MESALAVTAIRTEEEKHDEQEQLIIQHVLGRQTAKAKGRIIRCLMIGQVENPIPTILLSLWTDAVSLQPHYCSGMKTEYQYVYVYIYVCMDHVMLHSKLSVVLTVYSYDESNVVELLSWSVGWYILLYGLMDEVDLQKLIKPTGTFLILG